MTRSTKAAGREPTKTKRKEEEVKEENLEEDEYEVERIVDHKGKRGAASLRYLIKWKGYGDDDNTWEKAADMDAPELVEKYWADMPAAATKPKGRMGARMGAPNKRPRVEEDDLDDSADRMVITDGSYPPPGIDWEAEVARIRWLEAPSDPDGELGVFLKWNEKDDQDQSILTLHPMSTVRENCPQKLIDYLLSHIKFKKRANSE